MGGGDSASVGKGCAKKRQTQSDRDRRRQADTDSDKCNSVFAATLGQRECVGKVIKCKRQLCDKGKECAGVQQCEIYVRSYTSPQLGTTLYHDDNCY